MQGVVLRVAEAAVLHRGEGLLGAAALAFTAFEVALYQERVGLLIGAGGHRLSAGEEHAAIAGAGQRTVAAAADGLLEVFEAQCRSLEEFGVGQAHHLLPRQPVDPLCREVEEAHPRLAVAKDDRLAETVQQGMQCRGFQQRGQYLAADVDRGTHAHLQGRQEVLFDHGCSSVLCRVAPCAARSTATFQATPSCMRMREQ
ncbi:hypothetical protein D9M68_497150 [compost metagenome]